MPELEEAREAADLLDRVNIPRRGPDEDYTLAQRIQLLAEFLGVELVEGGVVAAVDSTPRIDFAKLDRVSVVPLADESEGSEDREREIADFFGLRRQERRLYKRPPVALAEVIEVERGPEGCALFIDGKEFPWYIDEVGVKTTVDRNRCPSITITILGDEVRVNDSIRTVVKGKPGRY